LTTLTEDNFASSILAGLLLIIMFGSMRGFYGCWPWEYRKTWYRTEKEIARLDALIGPSRPSDRRPESADTEETPTMPNPIADALRERIAESRREMIAESRRGTPPSDEALRADMNYPKQSTRFG
jgi:hypothetical protein